MTRRQVLAPLAHVQKITTVTADRLLGRLELPAKGDWLQAMVLAGRHVDRSRVRIADAVASTGMLVAGGPHKRAVVLVIADRFPDASEFTPVQAQKYLGDVMVPLFVWRAEDAKDDGWPVGRRVTAKTILDAVKEIHDALERQRIAWIEGDVNPAKLQVADAETEVAIAGRTEAVARARRRGCHCAARYAGAISGWRGDADRIRGEDAGNRRARRGARAGKGRGGRRGCDSR